MTKTTVSFFALGILATVSVTLAQDIYWVDPSANEILRSDLDGSDVEVILAASIGLPGSIAPSGIALDLDAGKMYWTDGGTGKIRRSNLDGTAVEDLFATGLFSPTGLALDLAGGKIYWLTLDVFPEPAKIQRANLDGSNVEDLVVSGLGRPRAIALDVPAGKMYWGDQGLTSDGLLPGIRRAALDGSNVELVLDVDAAPRPEGVALDLAAGKIYWSDLTDDVIRRADLDGSHIEDLVSSESGASGGPVGVALDITGGQMYWTHLNPDKVQRADLDGSNVLDLITQVGGFYRGIALDLRPQDCQPNGIPDADEIAAGTGLDCNGNEFPDECDLAMETSADCNTNGIPDECDTAGGSGDCNFNTVPDTCEPDRDCNGNGVRDICDIGAATSLDCNGNSIPDECDLAAGPSLDVNTNGRPDECEMPLPEDRLGIDCSDDADCPNHAICIPAPGGLTLPGTCYAPKNRSLSMEANPGNAGRLTARRLTVQTESGPVVLGWIGEPTPHMPQFEETQMIAEVVDMPVYRNWEEGSPLHLHDCHIAPRYTYLIHSIEEGKNVADESNYSLPIELRTVEDWADVVGALSNGLSLPPDCRVSFLDVDQVVRGFLGLNHAPWAWLKLDLGLGSLLIDNNDILQAANGFSGEPYPFSDPCTCAGLSPCPPTMGPILCSPSVCGDGNLDSGEECDDGDTLPGDGCDEFCRIEAPPVVAMQLIPIGATGPHSIDGNMIVLDSPGQEVALDLVVTSVDTAAAAVTVATYQATLDCERFDGSEQGRLIPVDATCDFFNGPVDMCIGVDTNRDDYLYPGGSVVPACNRVATCDEGSSGRFACGAVPLFPRSVQLAEPRYAATFAVSIPPDALGTFALGLDPDPARTMVLSNDGASVGPLRILPVQIVVPVDCNGNGTSDHVEIAAGSAPDCNGNFAPDECDLAGGRSTDVNGNGFPDECEDCNANSVFDGDDIALGTSADVNLDTIPDECLFAPLAEDSMNLSCTSDTDCPDQSGCIASRCYVPKGRYLSLQRNDMDFALTARRVSVDTGGGFVALGWMGPPDAQGVVRVVPDPHYAAWGVKRRVVQVADCEVTPGQAYLIQSIAVGFDAGNDANYSLPLLLPTTSDWGDVTGASGAGAMSPPNGIVDFTDISGSVMGFQQNPDAPPDSWLDLGPEVPDEKIDFEDILRVVDGFKEKPYPFASALDCP